MGISDHLEKLKYFSTVVDAGSILKASQELRIAQPHLSRVIQTLEAEIGEALLVRSKQGVFPTPTGQQMYLFAKKIAVQTTIFEHELRQIRPISMKLTIGSYDSIVRYFFPAFLKYLQTVHPELSINIESGRSSEIVKRIRAKELALGIIVEEREMKGLNFFPVYEDCFGAYRSPSIDPAMKSTLIYFKGWSPVQEMNFGNKMIVDNLETVRTLTEEGMGIGIMPNHVARQGLIKGTLTMSKIILSKEDSSLHRIGIVTPIEKKRLPEFDDFILEVSRFLKIWSQNK